MSTSPNLRAKNISGPKHPKPRNSSGAASADSAVPTDFRSSAGMSASTTVVDRPADSSPRQNSTIHRAMLERAARAAGASPPDKTATVSSLDDYRHSAAFSDDRPCSDAESDYTAPSHEDSITYREWDIDIELFDIFSGYKRVHGALCEGSLQDVSKLLATFLGPLVFALGKLDGAPSAIRDTSVYDAAYKNVLFARELLESHYDKIRPTLTGTDLNDFILTGYQLLEMTLNNFRNLLQVIDAQRSYVRFQVLPQASTSSSTLLEAGTCVIIPGPPLPDTPKKPRKLSFLRRLRVTAICLSTSTDSPVDGSSESFLPNRPSLDDPAITVPSRNRSHSRQSSYTSTHTRPPLDGSISGKRAYTSTGPRPSIDGTSRKTADSGLAFADNLSSRTSMQARNGSVITFSDEGSVDSFFGESDGGQYDTRAPSTRTGTSMQTRNGAFTTFRDEGSVDSFFGQDDGGKCNIRASLALFPAASHSLSLLEVPVRESEIEVIRGMDGSITAATIPALVWLFTDQREVLMNDLTDTIDAFFLFFRSFVPPAVFYDMLVARYSERPPPNRSAEQSSALRLYHRLAKMHVAKLLALWLGFHWKHDTDGDLLEKVVSFTYGTMAQDKDVPRETSKLVASNLFDRSAGRVSHYGEWLEKEATRTEDAVKPPAPTAFEPRLRHLETLRPDDMPVVDVGYFRKPGGAEELARQLTILEAEFFHAFLPEELIHFSEPEFQKKLEVWKTFSNALTLWVPNCILDHKEVSFRAELVELFISVAVACRNMRNYSSALAILLGLQSGSITRLQQTEQAVGKQYRDLRSQLEEFFDSRTNWRAYRAELPRNIPAVPLEVVVIKDVKQCREALPRAPSMAHAPSRATEELIYLQYCRNLRRTVRDLEKCYGSYKLDRVEFVQSWLKYNTNKFSGAKYEDRAQILHEKSLQAEPRTVKSKPSTLRLAND